MTRILLLVSFLGCATVPPPHDWTHEELCEACEADDEVPPMMCIPVCEGVESPAPSPSGRLSRG